MNPATPLLSLLVFASLATGRWVVALAAAALGVRGLATALVILRGVLIRTGIGALIVCAGELVYQFSKLVEGAGGFGEAMGLLKDLASEVWEQTFAKARGAGRRGAEIPRCLDQLHWRRGSSW